VIVKGKRVVPQHDEDITVKYVCDLCHKEAPKPWSKGWAESDYEVAEVEIRLKTGNRSPEGGYGEYRFFDLCPDCFNSILVPFLQGKGAQCYKEEWDW
jgi:hypothetical protein